jgi:hypothetical protein
MHLSNSGEQVERNIPNICQDDLHDLQKAYSNILMTLLISSHGDSETDGEDGFHRGVIFKGWGRIDKLRRINAVHISVDACEEATFATTGKAATVVKMDPHSIFKFQANMVLGFQLAEPHSYKPLQGQNSQETQNKLKHLKDLHLDDYLMLVDQWSNCTLWILDFKKSKPAALFLKGS